MDGNLELLDDSSENSYCKKRKLDNPNDSHTKRPKSINLFPEEDNEKSPPSKNCNPFLSTSAVQSEHEDSEAEEELNPFLDAKEQEYLPDDAAAEPNIEPILVDDDDDVETVAFDAETNQLGENLENNLDNFVPCITGVCNSDQVAVTLTITNSDGTPLKASI